MIIQSAQSQQKMIQRPTTSNNIVRLSIVVSRGLYTHHNIFLSDRGDDDTNVEDDALLNSSFTTSKLFV